MADITESIDIHCLYDLIPLSILSSDAAQFTMLSIKMNTDCLYEILTKTDASNVRSVANTLSTRWNLGNVDGLVERRLSPHKIFSCITDNTKGILKAMHSTNSILGGSRAAEYFYPGASSTRSDFDFYTNRRNKEFKEYLASIGVTWKYSTNEMGEAFKDSDDLLDVETTDSEHSFNMYPVKHFLVAYGSIQHRGTTFDIQLIDYTGDNTINAIIGYHSTASQCFITGLGAFSLYHILSEKRLMVHWDRDDEISVIRRDEAIKKYRQRGFQSITYGEYVDGISKSLPPEYLFCVWMLRLRYIGDDDARSIIFSDEYSAIPDAHERSLAIKKLKLFQWKEERFYRSEALYDKVYLRIMESTNSIACV